VNNAQPKEHKNKNSHDWDILIFTQQWPETLCKDWVHQKPSHTCVMPKKEDSWSIHGIWPTKLGTMGPEFCNRTWLLDPEEIRPIETDLMNVWTNIEGGKY
jgi:ribonuclease T2